VLCSQNMFIKALE